MVDRSSYYTHQHAAEFDIAWIAFYDFLDQWTAQARTQLDHKLDVAYGDDPQQRLDLYRPQAPTSGAPVFLFIHGGGFIEGDRAHYGAVALPFSKYGVLTVVQGYRIGPEIHYPEHPRDVAAALSWVHENIGRFGGDPNQIYLGGHSAGGILSAEIAFKLDWFESYAIPPESIKGTIPVSGPYFADDPAIAQYLSDPSLREQASPIFNVSRAPSKNLIAVGSEEPQWINENRELCEKLRAHGVDAELLVLDGQDHAETAMALCQEESQLFQRIVGYFEFG